MNSKKRTKKISTRKKRVVKGKQQTAEAPAKEPSGQAVLPSTAEMEPGETAKKEDSRLKKSFASIIRTATRRIVHVQVQWNIVLMAASVAVALFYNAVQVRHQTEAITARSLPTVITPCGCRGRTAARMAGTSKVLMGSAC